jgi:hypothetical protein
VLTIGQDVPANSVIRRSLDRTAPLPGTAGRDAGGTDGEMAINRKQHAM